MPGQGALSDDDDRDLLSRARAGERAAFDLLVQRYERRILRFARGLVRTDADADDVRQETFLSAWRAGVDQQTPVDVVTVRSWLFSIARHAAYRRGRRRAGQPASFEPLETLGAAAGWGSPEGPEEMAAALESRELLHRALHGLEPEDAAVIRLRDIEELTGEEAASALGVELGAMKSRLHRARLKLMAEVRREMGHGG